MIRQAGAAPSRHDTLREGLGLGLVVATGVWIWLAVVDVIVGEPFQTFTMLGGIAGFTVLHYVLNGAYGIAVVAGVHAAVREPGLIGVVATGVVVVEFAFALLTVLLSHLGLGDLAWVRIFGGSLIGAAIGYVVLARGHPLRRLPPDG
jgi:hypothetical protein